MSKNQTESPRPNNVPRHVAIILDGNGRWAKKRGLPRKMGHVAGADMFRRIARYCRTIGVEYLTVYAFSTENWSRPEDEVQALMSLLEKHLQEALETMEKNKVRLRFLGDMSRLSPELRELIRRAEELSSGYEGVLCSICVNYGGRDEISRAAAQCAREGLELTQENISRFLDTAGCPDPDLIIRTGGEQRLSNFLMWQSAYSELYFTPVLWPDFDEAELDNAIAEFCRRDRRFGGVKE